MKKLITCIIIMLIMMTIHQNHDFAQTKESSIVASDSIKQIIHEMITGDRKVLREISYEELVAVFDYTRVIRYPFPKKRSKVVNSALKGLFNKDPRVSLLCIEILRKMIPDRLMEPEVKLLYEQYSSIALQKDHKDYYTYRNIILGTKVTKSWRKEISKLYQFIQRDKLVYRLLNVPEDNQLLKSLDKNEFIVLSRAIDKEKRNRIPLRSVGKTKFFKIDQLEVIYHGLDNPNYVVKRDCANFLIDYYNYNALRMIVAKRNEIKMVLKKAYDNDIIAKPKLVKIRKARLYRR